MFHLGFSGARQGFSAIMLSSSESLPRADRDGPGGFSCPSSPHAVSLPQRGPCSLSHLAPGSRLFFQLASDLCPAGLPPPHWRPPGEEPSSAQRAHLSKRPLPPHRLGAFLHNSALGPGQPLHQRLLWTWSALWGPQGGLRPALVLGNTPSDKGDIFGHR